MAQSTLGILVESARLLARGGDLEARLDGLAAQACVLGGATSAVVYLLDGEAGVLVPAGTAGLADLDAHPLEPLTVGDGAELDAIGQAVRARRNGLAPVTPAMATGLPDGAAPGAVAHVALVTADEDGTEQVEGLLVAGLAATPADPAATLTALGAIGDLAAATIHRGRVERALVERSDWYDRLAQIDPLTGLANRRTFERAFELELARAGRQASPVSLALFDIDDLAGLGRRYGQDVADEILRRVAAALAGSVRLIDTVARVGGDEFAVLAPGSAGGLIAQRVLDAVAALETPGDAAARVSAGVAHFPADGAMAAELITAAEHALQAAKAGGGGRVGGAAETAG